MGFWYRLVCILLTIPAITQWHLATCSRNFPFAFDSKHIYCIYLLEVISFQQGYHCVCPHSYEWFWNKCFCNGEYIFIFFVYYDLLYSLQRRQNERYGVWNYWRLDCFLNRLLRRKSSKTTKLRVTGFLEGNPPFYALHYGIHPSSRNINIRLSRKSRPTLVMQGTRSSAAMVLIKFSPDTPISASEGTIYLCPSAWWLVIFSHNVLKMRALPFSSWPEQAIQQAIRTTSYLLCFAR